MKLKFLLMFLTLAAVGAGLCPAQTKAKKYLIIDGLFFNGMPPGISNNAISAFIMHTDIAGHKAMECPLREGHFLSEDAKAYRVPVDSVPGGEALLQSCRDGAGMKFSTPVPDELNLAEYIGKPFPDFKVVDITGKTWIKTDVLGKPFVLNFWYTGCSPCIREMPELNSWVDICPDATYFATTFDTAGQIAPVVKRCGFRFTQIAGDRFFFDTFKVYAMPVTVLVDKKGIVRYYENGTSPAKLDYMLKQLKALYNE